MSYYNHFAKVKYKRILFADVMIGEKFRVDLFKGKARRMDIIMIKTGEFSYIEMKGKKAHTAFTSDFHVSHYSQKLTNE